MPGRLKGRVISDFNGDVLVGYLNNLSVGPACAMTAMPFGQVFQILADPTHLAWSNDPDFVVIWCQPWSVLPSFQKLMNAQHAQPKDIEQEATALANQIKQKASQVKHVFVCLFTLPHHYRGLGPMDYGKMGIRRSLHRANAILLDILGEEPNVVFKDPGQWQNMVGPKAVNPKLWYVSKIPYDLEVFKAAALDIKESLGVFGGHSKKVIILDLDNTLWGGELGDVGMHHLKLGGHDPIGEAFVDFQRQLKMLKARGMVLAIVSKNDEHTALKTISSHPEMVLRQTDFAAWRINWSDKAQNIINLLHELNLPPTAAVFIDDHPGERDRVKTSLSDITVPPWPSDPFVFAQTILSMPYFDTVALTKEDLRRTEMYQAEQKRQVLKQPAMSVKDWLKTLHVVLTIEELDESNMSRAVQLLNKTNQMNLRTRRLTEQELNLWAKGDGRQVFVVRVQDDLGDFGLTGLLSLTITPEQTQLEDFILSCRVFGRFIEDAMLAKAVHVAAGKSRILRADFIPTDKNQPCLDFLRRSGLADSGTNGFVWDLAKPYAYPEVLTIQDRVPTKTGK